MRVLRPIWLSFLFMGLFLHGVAADPGGRVAVLTVKGAINPVVTNYISRGIGQAEDRGAAAVVIQLDTPGGLDTAMRDIIQRILGARIPVIVYVAPAGARAASAGTFIVMAAHVAAMALNTSIGAAHPVGGGGEVITGTLEEKVVNDAASYIRSLAEQRGRNAQWAEAAVRQSVSINEQEAVRLNVVEVVASDLPQLLSQINGRQVTLLGRAPVPLLTADVEMEYLDMTFIESFLLAISDPNIAYLLLSLAMTGLFLELANPGAILPGVVGGISLLLALFSLGMLPVNYAGVFLILLAFIFFITEVFVTSHGVLAVGGVVSLTVGSLILISSTAPYFEIDRRLIAAVVLGVSGFFIFVVGAIVRSHRRRPRWGSEGLVGLVAVARSPLSPEGLVFLQGERWRAIVDNGPVAEGEEVLVTKVEAMRLRVRRRQASGDAPVEAQRPQGG